MRKKQKPSKSNKKTKSIVIGGGIVIIIILIITFGDFEITNTNTGLTSSNENPRNAGWLHVHGLGIDPTDHSILYIATHGAFYQSISGAPPVKMDNSGADYMAFNAPPIPGEPLYASGHPARGGNTGLIKSTDGGRTWQKVSSVIEPAVDFHAMAVSKSEPNIILGFDSAGRGLFKTTDYGKTWNKLEYPEYIASLAISTNDSQLIFAGTGKGMFRSDDGGNSWTKVFNYSGERTFSLAFDGIDLYAFSPETGLERSPDLGQSWEKVSDVSFTITSMVIHPQTKDIYVGGMSSDGSQEVYKISPDGQNYELIGTNKK